MNDLRPIALTSVAFKSCERLVLPQLKSIVKDCMDPFQFAYKSDRSCEDAILSIIDSVTSHLDPKAVSEKNELKGVKEKVVTPQLRIMFFDFSSAFNTIQPHLLANKLLTMDVPKSMIFLDPGLPNFSFPVCTGTINVF